MEYTTVKIPDVVYENLKMMQAEISRKGVVNIPNSIKDLITSLNCPYDSTRLVKSMGIFYKCTKCGLYKPVTKVDTASTEDIFNLLKLSTIVTLALIVLNKEMMKK